MRLPTLPSIFLVFLLSAPGIRAQTAVSLASGWNLAGNSNAAVLNVADAAFFGNPDKVTSVWKWIPASGKWAFYAPSLNAQALNEYAASKNYEVLAAINGGEGFWVNAKSSFSIALPNGSAVLASTLQTGFPPGWSLAATGETKNPADFDASSLWAWDNRTSSWYFFAHLLNNSGELPAYIQNKGYLDFTAANKKLGPGVGFWVKKADPGVVSNGDYPAPGNPDGNCAVPAEGAAEDVTHPTQVIGNGTPESCTSDAVVQAVAKGGIITFNCGPDPVKITMTQPAKVVNNTGPKIVIDGGGKVMLSGGGTTRILYMNTCDQNQVWTTSHCQNQDHPQLTVQNLTFMDVNSKGAQPDGGGAIWVRGGRFKVVNSRFFSNQCDDTGPDVGGAAMRIFSQYQTLPVYVVKSTFGGRADLGNICSNGGGLSSIGVSFSVINSLFSHNQAVGNGANPARNGTPGGGSGGAIYNDGNTFHLKLCGTDINSNSAREGGGAIFFVSNDRTGTLAINQSSLSMNLSEGFETNGYPGVFYLGNGSPQVSNSTLTPKP